MASGKITTKNTLSGSISKSSGTSDHARLLNREEANQHPIKAITGLSKELDAKLDADTALPLIEEAVQNKARGLYFDAMRELFRKPCWYLTSEIDPKTGQGTKESVISGPYDLGMGGGTGTGTGSSLTTVSIKPVNWPTTTVVGNPLSLAVEWSSVIGDQKEPTGNGSIYLYIDDKQTTVKSGQAQGIVTFENINLSAGNHVIRVEVMDAYGSRVPYVGTITATELLITDDGLFDDGTPWNGEVKYKYKAFGDFSKTIYFIVDGNTDTPYKVLENVTTSGDLAEEFITGLSHGAHTLEVYFTTELNGETVSSNKLYHELIVYEKENATPIITSSFAKESTQEQYVAFNIPYYVYSDILQQPRVYYYVEYQGVRTELATFAGGILVDQGLQKLPYRFDTYYESESLNNYSLIIKCGTTEKKFNITVAKSSISLTPVTTALVLHLDAQGRSNTEANRASWIDKASKVSCELTGFNWASNGWLDDPVTNESFLRLNAGAKVTVPYKVLSGTPQLGGKTIELDFAARDIRDYETPILTCRNATVRKFYDVSTTFVDADIRAKNFTVTLNQDLFTTVYPNAGTYIFEYIEGDSWRLISGEVADLTTCGITLTEHLENEDGEHLDKWKLTGDLIVVSVVEDAIGFYVTPQKAAIRSLQSKLSVQFKEEEHVRLSIVIEDASITSPTHILWIYVNGIASCAIQYPLQGENFAHENFMYLGADDGVATLDIYNIRVYNQALTSKQIVENWIADTQDPALRASRYAKNNIYDKWSKKITPESIEALGDLPYIIWDIDTLPTFKGDKRLGNVVYKDPLGKDRSFKSGDATYNVQGTSSAGYPVKNIRIKYKKAKAEDFPNCDFWWENGYENEDGEEIKKFPITVGGIGDNYFTYKVDYASSEGANNVELTKLYNDLSQELAILTPPQRKNSNVRVGIDGFPIVAFHEDAAGTRTFCTKANFNNDKDNEDVYGFAAGDESWEITNNSFRTTKFKTGVNITDKSSSDYYSKAFEARFPEDNSDLSRLKAMTDWVASTDPEQATGKSLIELLGVESITFNYTDKELDENNSYKDVEKSDTFDTDSRDYRITKFKAELKDWFDVNSTLLYYLFTELFLMIDSRAKNAFPTYFKSRQEGDGGDRWFWIPYDMDTALGINNMGELVFDYSLEDHGEYGKYAGGKVYNGQESVMWNNVREGFYGQLSAMYARMRSSLINFAEIDRRFEEHQNKWPEAIFNEDAIIKYVNPLRSKAEGGLGENYLSMLQGSKAQQRKWWLYNRLRYIDSKYNAADAKSDYIQFRAYAGGAGTAKPSISVIPYTDIYAAVSYSNGELKTARAPRNIVTTVPTSFTAEDDSNEQETYIYSASQLKDIGDLAPFYAKTVKVAAATKLQKLKVGDDGQKYPGYKNENLRQLDLGENTLLKILDVRNCVNLGKVDPNDKTVTATPDINLNKCTNIEEIYFTGTQITGITLPDGGTIKKLYLPGTMQSLALQNQPLIEELQIERVADPKTGNNYLEIENLWLENIPFDKIDVKEILQLMANKPAENIGASFIQDKGKYQRGVYLKGIKEHFNTIEDLQAFVAVLDEFFGLVFKGQLMVPDLESKAIVSGDITLSGQIDYTTLTEFCDWDDEEQKWRLKAYKDTFVHVDTVVCTVIFDPANKVDSIEFKNVAQGSTCQAIPSTPIKQATPQYSYEFMHWMTDDGKPWNPSEPIIRSMTLTAVYAESIRQYTVTYKTNSNIISVEPAEITVDYGDVLVSPQVSGIPTDGSVIFTGWFDESKSPAVPWVFYDSESSEIAPTKVEANVELTAHWIDKGDPDLQVFRKTYDTFKVKAVDNLGISGYALLDTEEVPIEWTEITPTTQFIEDLSITAASTYWLWVTDQANRTAKCKIVAYPLSLEPAVGTLTLQFSENGTILPNFAISGTTVTVYAEPDPHYNLTINLNGNPIQNNTEHKVDAPLSVTTTCTPNNYTIKFVTGKEASGVTFVDQTIAYLQHIQKPFATYHNGYIISNWYLDNELTQLWNFDSDVVKGDLTLYAEWQEYITPTSLNVSIPYDTTTIADRYYENYGLDKSDPYTIIVWFSQQKANTVRIDFGDGTGEVTSPSQGSAIKVTHTYATEGNYTIKIYGTASGYDIGGGQYYRQVVVPASCIKSVDFAWDLTSTREYAFMGADISELNLTAYMVSIGMNTFASCKKLTSLVIPKSIKVINQQAFENCSGILGTVFLPKTVSFAGNNVFAGCEKLDEISFEESGELTTIGDQFARKSGIKRLIIPYHIEHIGKEAFSMCDSLEKVVFMNPSLTTGERIFNSSDLLFTAGPIDWELGAGNNPNYDIEFAWTEEIPDNAFSYSTTYSTQTKLKEVVLPDSIKRIGAKAFAGTWVLRTIQLPYNLEYIGEEAFYCSGITRIDVPEMVTQIGPRAFRKCVSMTSAILRLLCSDPPINYPGDGWFLDCNNSLEPQIPQTLFENQDLLASNYGDTWNIYSYSTTTGESIALDYTAISN